MNFTSGKQLLDICSEKNISISQAMFLRETTYLEQDSVEVTQKMERAYDIMKQSIHRALNEDLIGMGGMIGGESKHLDALRKSGKNICGTLISKAITYAVGVLEVNASMGLIVAAPTAGLHFTPEVLADIDARGIGREEVTLHVGAGTFKPVKSDTIEGHEMHTEFISVRRSSIERIKSNLGNIIAVGTTSVRTLESLYYMGVILDNNPEATSEDLVVKQWMPYDTNNNRLTAERSLQNILNYLDKHDADTLVTATQIIIAPGYEFKIVKGIVTNFHQPKSTLLLLISAFVKGNWKSIYEYALEHDFRFLSYGDSSLLL